MKKLVVIFLFLLDTAAAQQFSIQLPANISEKPLDGRLLLMLSVMPGTEPRFQIADDTQTQQVFGIDVEGWKPGTSKTIDANAFGYPAESLKQIKAGTYQVQALLHIYETFKRKDGHIVKLPMDRGRVSTGILLRVTCIQFLFLFSFQPESLLFKNFSLQKSFLQFSNRKTANM